MEASHIRTPNALDGSQPSPSQSTQTEKDPQSTAQSQQPKPIALRRVIRGNSAVSHAGDNPADGPDVPSCVNASGGWTIVEGSGHIVVDSIVNGSLGQTGQQSTPDHFCATFYIVRADRGHSAGVQAHVEAVETRTTE